MPFEIVISISSPFDPEVHHSALAVYAQCDPAHAVWADVAETAHTFAVTTLKCPGSPEDLKGLLAAQASFAGLYLVAHGQKGRLGGKSPAEAAALLAKAFAILGVRSHAGFSHLVLLACGVGKVEGSKKLKPTGPGLLDRPLDQVLKIPAYPMELAKALAPRHFDHALAWNLYVGIFTFKHLEACAPTHAAQARDTLKKLVESLAKDHAYKSLLLETKASEAAFKPPLQDEAMNKDLEKILCGLPFAQVMALVGGRMNTTTALPEVPLLPPKVFSSLPFETKADPATVLLAPKGHTAIGDKLPVAVYHGLPAPLSRNLSEALALRLARMVIEYVTSEPLCIFHPGTGEVYIYNPLVAASKGPVKFKS